MIFLYHWKIFIFDSLLIQTVTLMSSLIKNRSNINSEQFYDADVLYNPIFLGLIPMVQTFIHFREIISLKTGSHWSWVDQKTSCVTIRHHLRFSDSITEVSIVLLIYQRFSIFVWTWMVGWQWLVCVCVCAPNRIFSVKSAYSGWWWCVCLTMMVLVHTASHHHHMKLWSTA